MNNKKKLGIIGGMGSRAGAFFLQKILDYSPATTDQEFLEILFHNNSKIPDRTRAIVYNEPSPLPEILRSVELFERNKVEVIALACITSYYYYDTVAACTSADVLNPLQLVAKCINDEHRHARRVGVLATTGTISTGLFHKALASCNVQIVTLNEQDQENVFMRSVYMKNGFKSAVISGEARELMNEAIETLIRLRADIIIGGCTEVSIAVDPACVRAPYVDCLDLLAKRTVDLCYNLDLRRSKKIVNG